MGNKLGLKWLLKGFFNDRGRMLKDIRTREVPASIEMVVYLKMPIVPFGWIEIRPFHPKLALRNIKRLFCLLEKVGKLQEAERSSEISRFKYSALLLTCYTDGS